MKGIGKGLLGAVASPVSGVLDALRCGGSCLLICLQTVQTALWEAREVPDIFNSAAHIAAGLSRRATLFYSIRDPAVLRPRALTPRLASRRSSC